jgi:hypothetical protein
MYIVVSTFKISESNSADNWTAHETLEEAQQEYYALLEKPNLYSASITETIQSTDY